MYAFLADHTLNLANIYLAYISLAGQLCCNRLFSSHLRHFIVGFAFALKCPYVANIVQICVRFLIAKLCVEGARVGMLSQYLAIFLASLERVCHSQIALLCIFHK